MQHNSLPSLIHSHARHVLEQGTRTRPGILLVPQQLIASKTVRAPAHPPRTRSRLCPPR
jgi:hypothetical protein